MCIQAAGDMTAILLVGLENGDVSIYRTVLSWTQPIKLCLVKQLSAHVYPVMVLHIHPTKPLFVSSGDCRQSVSVWSFQKATSPRLITELWHPYIVSSAKISHSGAILTGCLDGWLRVFNMAPWCSLRWKCNVHGPIYSVAWSPSSHRIAASFGNGKRHVVQVWDARTLAMHVIGKAVIPDHFGTRLFNLHRCYSARINGMFVRGAAVMGGMIGNLGVSFPSNDFVLCCGSLELSVSNCLYSFNIPKSTVTSYQSYSCKAMISAQGIIALNSKIVCASYDLWGKRRSRVSVYKLEGTNLRELAALPCVAGSLLAGCMLPYDNNRFVLACSGAGFVSIHVSGSNKLTSDSIFRILPFCTDVQKIIFKYLVC